LVCGIGYFYKEREIMRIRPCFVSIHGIDGTGKTSTAIKLMKILSQENQNIEMFNMGATYV